VSCCSRLRQGHGSNRTEWPVASKTETGKEYPLARVRLYIYQHVLCASAADD